MLILLIFLTFVNGIYTKRSTKQLNREELVKELEYLESDKNKKYGVTGSWTQGLVHAKHALYQLSYNPVVSTYCSLRFSSPFQNLCYFQGCLIPLKIGQHLSALKIGLGNKSWEHEFNYCGLNLKISNAAQLEIAAIRPKDPQTQPAALRPAQSWTSLARSLQVFPQFITVNKAVPACARSSKSTYVSNKEREIY